MALQDAIATALKQLEATPQIVQALINSLSERQAALKPSPTSFSVAETITHLLHVEKHCYESRIAKILAQDAPPIPEYDVKHYEAAGAYTGMTVAAAMNDFRHARSENLATLKRLAADQFSRAGIHETVGRFTLGEMVNEWAAHDLGHIRQVANIMRDVRHIPAMGPFRE